MTLLYVFCLFLVGWAPIAAVLVMVGVIRRRLNWRPALRAGALSLGLILWPLFMWSSGMSVGTSIANVVVEWPIYGLIAGLALLARVALSNRYGGLRLSLGIVLAALVAMYLVLALTPTLPETRYG